MKLFFTFVCFLTGLSFSSLLPAVTGETVPSSEGSVRGHVARELPSIHCDCARCDASAFNAMAGAYSCGARISWLESTQNLSEREACMKIAGEEFANDCGSCNPATCDSASSVQPAVETGSVTAVRSAPVQGGNSKCGCPACDGVWNDVVNGYSCGERIEWLQGEGSSEMDACSKVGSDDFPNECGKCDPDTCNNNDNEGDEKKRTNNNGASNAINNAPTNSNGATGRQLCGAAVGGAICDFDHSQCSGEWGACGPQLWDPMEAEALSYSCYAYGGRWDPCAVNAAGGDGETDKDPGDCMRDTYFLWDEPVGTQGRSASWPLEQWRTIVRKHTAGLQAFRARGGVVTAPMFRSPCGKAAKDFLDACGEPCRDPNDPHYIGAVAGNYFATGGGATTYESAVANAEWIIGDMREITDSALYSHLPIYITNWATNHCHNAGCQYASMQAAEKFLELGWRVYWFAAQDCPDGNCRGAPNMENHFLYDNYDGQRTMGQMWKEICDRYS